MVAGHALKLATAFLIALFHRSSVLGQYPCIDIAAPMQCYSWRFNGMCQSRNYQRYMYDNCRQTCNMCPVTRVAPPVVRRNGEIECRDDRAKCHTWKRHCQRTSEHYDFMTLHCRRTCLFCSDDKCEDQHRSCPQYQVKDYCSPRNKYFKFMRRKCERSCRFCRQLDIEETVKAYAADERLFACYFEQHECDWMNEHFEDTGEWRVGTVENGPEQGFNGSQKYLYLDTDYESYSAKLLLLWQLALPDAFTKYGDMCLHFELRMTGGKVSVTQNENPSMEDKFPAVRTVFTTEKLLTQWTHVKMTVDVRDDYYLTLQGTKGMRGTYVAIDNIFFTEGVC